MRVGVGFVEPQSTSWIDSLISGGIDLARLAIVKPGTTSPNISRQQTGYPVFGSPGTGGYPIGSTPVVGGSASISPGLLIMVGLGIFAVMALNKR